MFDLLPELIGRVDGEHNALLTLARMWRTLTTNAFISKNAAAWAGPQLSDQAAATLSIALGGFLLRGLSYACRRPKLFTVVDCPLSRRSQRIADVLQPTRAGCRFPDDRRAQKLPIHRLKVKLRVTGIGDIPARPLCQRNHESCRWSKLRSLGCCASQA